MMTFVPSSFVLVVLFVAPNPLVLFVALPRSLRPIFAWLMLLLGNAETLC